MKRIKFFAILLCAFSLVAFYSCSKDEDEPATTQQQNNDNGNGNDDGNDDGNDPEPTLEEMVIGTWQGSYTMTLGTLNFTITLNQDHSGELSVTVASMPLSATMSNWTLTDRTLTATVSLQMVGEKSITAEIVSVDETTMVLSVSVLGETSDPADVTLTRVNAN